MGVTRNKQAGDQTKVFIPFPAANSNQHILSSQGWRSMNPGDIFCIDSPILHAQLSALNGSRDVLYIRGHCNSGTTQLESSDHSVRVSVKGVFDALTGHLPTSFPGIVKVYACLSSVDQPGLFWGTWKSFAQEFATKMWAGRYRNCKIWGYKNKVTTFASAASIGGTAHKWVGDADWEPDEETGPDMQRASVALERVYPEFNDSILPF